MAETVEGTKSGKAFGTSAPDEIFDKHGNITLANGLTV